MTQEEMKKLYDDAIEQVKESERRAVEGYQKADRS